MTDKKFYRLLTLSLIAGIFALTLFLISICNNILWALCLGWVCMGLQAWCLLTTRRHVFRPATNRGIVDELPKCWGLNDAGELVQDVPVVSGMDIWYRMDALGHTTGDKRIYWHRVGRDWDFSKTYDSREAAEKREDI